MEIVSPFEDEKLISINKMELELKFLQHANLRVLNILESLRRFPLGILEGAHFAVIKDVAGRTPLILI